MNYAEMESNFMLWASTQGNREDGDFVNLKKDGDGCFESKFTAMAFDAWRASARVEKKNTDTLIADLVREFMALLANR